MSIHLNSLLNSLLHGSVSLPYFPMKFQFFVTMLPGKSSHAARQVCPWPCISSSPHFHHKSHSHTSNHFTFSLRGRSIKLNFLRAALKEFRDIWFHWFPFNHPEAAPRWRHTLMMKAYWPQTQEKRLWNMFQDNHSLRRFTVQIKHLCIWNVIFVEAKHYSVTVTTSLC